MQTRWKGIPDRKGNCHHPSSALKGQGKKRRAVVAQPIALHPARASLFAKRGYAVVRNCKRMIDLDQEELSVV
jgi:hypothetical protein